MAPSRSGRPVPVRLQAPQASAESAIESSDLICLRQRMNSRASSPGLSVLEEAYAAVDRFTTRTSLPESRKARGLSRTEFTTVNMETVPPMPTLRERIAVSAKPGAERKVRKALRKSSSHIMNLQFGFPGLGLRRAIIRPHQMPCKFNGKNCNRQRGCVRFRNERIVKTDSRRSDVGIRSIKDLSR